MLEILDIENILNPVVSLVGGLFSWLMVGTMKKASRDLVKGKEKDLNLYLPLVLGSGLKLFGWAPLIAVPWATLVVSLLGGSIAAGTAHDKISSPLVKTIKKLMGLIESKSGKKKGK